MQKLYFMRYPLVRFGAGTFTIQGNTECDRHTDRHRMIAIALLVSKAKKVSCGAIHRVISRQRNQGKRRSTEKEAERGKRQEEDNDN